MIFFTVTDWCFSRSEVRDDEQRTNERHDASTRDGDSNDFGVHGYAVCLVDSDRME